MPIVDIEKIEQEAKKKEDSRMGIISKVIGDKTYFKGKVIDAWYPRYDECHSENEKAAQLAEFKSQGLNELGQSAEQVAIIEAVKKLKLEKSELMKKIGELETKISDITSGKIKVLKEEKKEVKESKESKKK